MRLFSLLHSLPNKTLKGITLGATVWLAHCLPGRLLAALGLALMLGYAQAASQVIELKHRTAAELLPVITPLLEPYERASHWGYQLIIQADQAKINEIQQLLEQLDTPPRRLLISVDTQGSSITQENRLNAGRHAGDKPDIRFKRYSSQGSQSGIRSIQTLEGSAALIQSGQEITRQQWSVNAYGRPQQQTQQRNLTQGYLVTATVHGDHVTLELNHENDRLDRQDQRVIQTQHTSTRISGPLNQWINVSLTGSQAARNSQDILLNSKKYTSDNNSLRIKVEILD